MFSCKSCKDFKNTFFIEHLGVAAFGRYSSDSAFISLTLSWWRSLPYSNQSTNLQCKSMDWFLHDRELRHERVKVKQKLACLCSAFTFNFNSFRPSIACYVETRHLICCANDMTGFYMKCNTRLQFFFFFSIRAFFHGH